jgi:prevent-host-death family protein
MEVNIHQAKTNLSRLILQAEAGEEVIIARAGKPVVKLIAVAAATPKKFKAGALKGRLFVPDNFPDPDPELEALFNDGPIFPEAISPALTNPDARTDGGRKRPRPAPRVRLNSTVDAKRGRTTR